jgi:class 3 adenylate cyclase
MPGLPSRRRIAVADAEYRSEPDWRIGTRKVRQLGIDVRAGVHTGECELMGDNIGGVAVHIGARIMAKAEPGSVLVSGTVKDLVSGSGIDFEDRGVHNLKGIPGDWRLFMAR